MWTFEAFEIQTPDGGKSGRWRMTKACTWENNELHDMCNCPDGHESEEAAKECPVVKRELEKIFVGIKIPFGRETQ